MAGCLPALLTFLLLAKSTFATNASSFPYKTGFTTFQVDGFDPTDRTVEVYFPVDTKSGNFRLISYAHGNGGGGSGERLAYESLLAGIASFGYVVVAPQACNVGCSDLASLPLDPPGE